MRASAWAGGIAGVLFATSALAVGGEPVHIVYNAPPSCTDSARFLARIAARTRLFRRAKEDEPARSFAVTIEADGSGSRGKVTIRERDGREAVREVRAKDCDEVVGALSFIIAVTIDPHASAEPTPPEAEPPPPEPPPPAPPATVPKATSPPPLARAAAQSAPPPTRWRLGLGAHLAGASAIAPSLVPAIQGLVELRREGAGLLVPALRISGIYARTAWITTDEGPAAQLTWVVARLEGCPVEWPGGASRQTVRLALSPCFAFDGGALIGAGRDAIDASTETSAWVAPGLLGRGQITLFDRLLIEAELGATVPLVTYHFYFGPKTTVFTVPRLGAIGGIGAGVRFP